MIDRQLLKDAHDSALAAVAVTEEALSLEKPTRSQIDNAQRHVSAANTKLVEYQCQMSGISRKEK